MANLFSTPLTRSVLASFFTLFSLATAATSVQKVTVELAEKVLFFPEEKATALARSINHAQVPAQISAQVNKINVHQGSRVVKDQLLVELDCQGNRIRMHQAKSRVAISEAQLEQGRRNLTRLKKLHVSKNIGEAELDNSELQVRVVKQQLLQAKAGKDATALAVARCQVRAPYDGMVTLRLVNEGDYVNSGTPLIKLLDNNSLEIEAQIPVEKINRFKEAVNYQFDNHRHSYPVNIKNIVEFIEKNSRSQLVTFHISPQKGTSHKVLAGMSGMLKWRAKLSYYPPHLLTQRYGRYGIFIIEKQAQQTIARFVEVPHAQEGRPFMFDLAKETQIIIDGRHRILPDSTVVIANK